MMNSSCQPFFRRQPCTMARVGVADCRRPTHSDGTESKPAPWMRIAFVLSASSS